MDQAGEGVDLLAVQKDVQFDQVGLFVANHVIVKRCVALGDGL